jgi:ABC-type transport system involved in Fe-S cluster assembly fused permease/ATPase subunit
MIVNQLHTARSEINTHARVILQLLPWLWPKGEAALRRRVVWSFLCLILAKSGEVAIPLVYARLVDAVAEVDRTNVVTGIITAVVLGYGALRISSGILSDLRDLLFAKVRARATQQIAVNAFRHVSTLSMRFHLENKTGSLSRILQRGTAGIAFLLELILFNIVPTLLEFLLVCFILWGMFGLSFAIITFTTILLYILVTTILTEWRIRLRRRMNIADEEASNVMLEAIGNFQAVKDFCNEDYEAGRYYDAMSRYSAAYIKHDTSLRLLNMSQNFIITAGLLITMMLATDYVSKDEMSLGGFVAVVAYLMQLYLPLEYFGFVYREIKQGLVDIEAMFSVLEHGNEISDLPGVKTLESGPGELKFERVRFSYEAARDILKDISFTAAPGRTLAIVGPTGSGKSTISRLIFRYFDVTAGHVLIDNQDITAVTQQSLRACVGIVPQDTALFNETIKYNIMYGSNNATEQEVEGAARLAQIHGFIVKLPNGYNTVVGQRGLRLSGGERQRLAIARAILKNPRILILDEATSALDAKTERDIQAALYQASLNRTTIVITHRLSTIVEADTILVLNDGRVFESGTHNELLELGGLYAEMWFRQSEAESN